ncbi:MAG: extracellular solute-binding protein, partial [Gammaproteobacteria bacterium]|nr:extracellular solute-binding protein [Gammaproteobacteria bacterium]
TDIKKAVVTEPRTVRFEFARVNPELHMIIAQMPVFSRAWVGKKAFDKTSLDNPLGSGPYIIERYNLGKDIIYKRNPNYWAGNLNTRRGMFNFDRIVYKYYKDETVQLEALKAGEFDFILVSYSKQWARDYHGSQFDEGRIIREELKHSNNAGMQGFAINTRRELFKDKRVRRALSLAFDFTWSNKNLFYDQYVRCDSYFSNSELASRGLPQGDELALLNKYRDKIDPAVFTTVWRPSITTTPQELRQSLRQAKALLEEAGWRVRDGVLKNDKGQVFTFEVILVQKGFERILAPYAHHLKKLGIEVRYRTVDRSLYTRRLRTFDFDMVVTGYGQSQSPGNELYNRWHSRAANQQGSSNLMGVADPAIDALIEEVVFAPDRKRLVTAVRALDRLMLHGEYLVPNWYIDIHRVAYWNKFGRPKTVPLYYEAENWATMTWWEK